MGSVTLLEPTGDPIADAVVSGVVGIFEIIFPDRIRGYYVEGSYADQTAVATSDVDLIVIFKDRWSTVVERETAEKLTTHCAALSKVELDIVIEDESDIAGGVYPSLKLGSRLIYGEDIRDRVPLLPIEAWTRQRMHAAYWLIVNVFHRPRPVHAPLDYPEPAGEFYGYDQRVMRLPDERQVRCTRDLIRVTGWAATALIALKTQHYVGRKRDCHLIYQQEIGDEWTPLLADIYERCRNAWNYLIPEDAAGRQLLRAICARTLLFENYFLTVYREFLLRELRATNEQAHYQALRVLSHTPYQDKQITTALSTLAASENPQLQEAAVKVLRQFDGDV